MLDFAAIVGTLGGRDRVGWAMTTANATDADDTTRMKFSELITLSLQLNGRLDLLWQRVLYSHAAIIGVMVFFGSSELLYAVPRILVFSFYTANTIITIYAFSETLLGLRAVIEDLRAMQDGEAQT